MKVCMITTHFPPDFGWSGTGRANLELANGLASLGHEVEVIACAEDETAINNTYQDGVKVSRVIWKKQPRTGLVAHTIPRSRFMLNLSVALWSEYLKCAKDTPYDIVDATCSYGESVIPALTGASPVVSRLYDRRAVFVEKELSFLGDTGFKFENELEKFFQNIAVSLSDDTVTISSDLLANTDNSTASHLINYPLDTELFCPEGEKALDLEGKPSLIIRMPVKDSAVKQKAGEIVRALMAEIPDLAITIVAPDLFTEDSEAQIKEELAAVGFASNMIISTGMSRLISAPLWRSADCALLLDWKDETPYAVLEALACGVPVVAENLLEEQIWLKDKSVILSPEVFSAPTVAEKLKLMISNSAESKSQRLKSRQYILDNHCHRQAAKQCVEYYENAIKRSREGTHISKRVGGFERALELVRKTSDRLDSFLYDLMFVHSFRFKVSHWVKKFNRKASKR